MIKTLQIKIIIKFCYMDEFLSKLQNLSEDDLQKLAVFLNEKVLQSRNNKVSTPLPIVYRRKDGNTFTLPYLDLARVKEVWGIQVGDVFFKKTHEMEDVYEKAHNISKKASVKDKHYRFALTSEFQKAFELKDEFNQTAEILRRHAVQAENWQNGSYWCYGAQTNTALKFSMENGTSSVYAKHCGTTGFVRLIIE